MKKTQNCWNNLRGIPEETKEPLGKSYWNNPLKIQKESLNEPLKKFLMEYRKVFLENLWNNAYKNPWMI